MPPTNGETKFLRHLYDAYRTARMNQLYYGWRLTGTRRANLVLEIAIAVSSSSSVAAWGLWEVPESQIAWQSLAGLGVLLALIKPFLNLGQRIERFARLYAGHGDVHFDLHQVTERVAEAEATTAEDRQLYRSCMERLRKLIPDDEPLPNEKLLRSAYDKVKREIPAGRLWMPRKGG